MSNAEIVLYRCSVCGHEQEFATRLPLGMLPHHIVPRDPYCPGVYVERSSRRGWITLDDDNVIIEEKKRA